MFILINVADTIAAVITLYCCPQRELVTKSLSELGSGRRAYFKAGLLYEPRRGEKDS